jgi:hypothetical protein
VLHAAAGALIDGQAFRMIGKYRENVLIFRAFPDVMLGMVRESNGAHTKRAPVRMTHREFQKKRDKSQETVNASTGTRKN